MATNNQTVEIILSKSNAGMVAIIAAIWGVSEEEVISFCLKGSTNPTK